MPQDAYEIYIDLRPIEIALVEDRSGDDAPWTLSGALTSRGAPTVGTTVPLSIRTHQPPPNRLRRRGFSSRISSRFSSDFFRWLFRRDG
jgi:hypothetical protein